MITKNAHTVSTALETLLRVFPGFISNISGKTICDFGCGAGLQTLAMSTYGKLVVGYDTNLKNIAISEPPPNVFFTSKVDGLDSFDVVISQNSMEHYGEPEAILYLMESMLKPKGRVYITFGPPWFAPYGAHMFHFTRMPWVHLLLPEFVMMKWRGRYRKDGAKRYEDVENGLNKMSFARFNRLIKKAGLKVEYTKIEAVKGLDFLTRIPLVRELFINQISVILTRKYDYASK